MTPLQKVAMGLVIVFLRTDFSGYDALADPVGWALVLAGVWSFRHRLPGSDVLLWLGGLAAAVSVVLVAPAVTDRLSASGQWGAGLPQTAFCLALCGSLAGLVEHASAAGEEVGETAVTRGRRVGTLRWVYLVVGVGPVVVYGGGVSAVAAPLAVLAVLANVALVWWTFGLSRLSREPAAESS